MCSRIRVEFAGVCAASEVCATSATKLGGMYKSFVGEAVCHGNGLVPFGNNIVKAKFFMKLTLVKVRLNNFVWQKNIETCLASD